MWALKVELLRDTTDWVLVLVSVLAALGTVGAVAVALLGPGWRERSKRPDVRLVVHALAGKDLGWQKDIDIDRPDQTQDYPPIWITNERGKEPARDVEVFATVGESLGASVWAVKASRDNLLFSSPMEGHYGDVQTHVPAGFSREVFFLTFGHPDSIYEGLVDDGGEQPSDPNADLLGILATFPARRSRAVWLGAGTYAVTFFITGSNFDAVTYVGHFELGRAELSHKDRSMVRQTFRWTSRPKKQVETRAARLFRRRESTVASPNRGDDWSQPEA